MKYQKHQDTTAQIRDAIAKSGYIDDFVSAKFLGYQDGDQLHLVEGLNFQDPGEPNFKYLMLIDPATGEVTPGSPPMADYEID